MKIIFENGAIIDVTSTSMLFECLQKFNQSLDENLIIYSTDNSYIQAVIKSKQGYMIKYKNFKGELYEANRDDIPIYQVLSCFEGFYKSNDSWRPQLKWNLIAIIPNESKRNFSLKEEIHNSFRDNFPDIAKSIDLLTHETLKSQYKKGAVFFLGVSLLLYILISYGFYGLHISLTYHTFTYQ
ncbi:MAG: hypothetical protein K0Q51_104 [Rickettsiaceae bacterium]|jgi:hypothetical protein|nr:hypothetical protein [Rickettsiaceae bacterium]